MPPVRLPVPLVALAVGLVSHTLPTALIISEAPHIPSREGFNISELPRYLQMLFRVAPGREAGREAEREASCREECKIGKFI